MSAKARFPRAVRLPSIASVAVTLILLFGGTGLRANDATLAEQLNKIAPEILRELSDRGYGSVGVLKFRVQKGKASPSDNVGELNMLIADRLRTALALKAGQAGGNLRLVRNASEVAATIPGANHLTSEGRQQFFLPEHKYAPAWGDGNIEVDALLTGLVRIDSDLRSMRVGVISFGRTRSELELIVPEFRADVDGTLLNEIGESYSTESFQVRSVGAQRDIADNALDVRTDPESAFPLVNGPSVALRIFYDEAPVHIEFRDGEAVIPEPKKGQNVEFELKREDDTGERLAVVLKLNGENTFYRERRPAAACTKWVLEPRCPPIRIRGYQRTDSTKHADKFCIVSREKSGRLEMDYGADVGTISIVVFRQRTATDEGVEAQLSSNDADVIAVDRASYSDERAPDAAALATKIGRSVTGIRTRGLIVPGKSVSQPISIVRFDFAPAPIMAAVIRYYRPLAKP